MVWKVVKADGELVGYGVSLWRGDVGHLRGLCQWLLVEAPLTKGATGVVWPGGIQPLYSLECVADLFIC